MHGQAMKAVRPAVVDHKQRALVLLGDLASLAGDLAQANQHYEEALALARTRTTALDRE